LVVLDAKALPVLDHPAVRVALIAEKFITQGTLTEAELTSKLDAALVVPEPRLALGLLLGVFAQPFALNADTASTIHPTACVDPTASVDPSAHIGAYAVVGPQCAIGARTRIYPQVTVGAGVQMGDDVMLHSGARILDGTLLGNRVSIGANAVIGADGFSYVTPGQGSIESARHSGGKITAKNTALLKIPSIGNVILADDVEVGPNTTIDRANLGATRIGKGTKLDNLVMIGHNNTIGENCLIVSQVGVAGSCTIGDRVVLAGQVGLKDHLSIGDDAIVMAKSGVMNDVAPETMVIGIPAMPQREQFLQFAQLRKLGKLFTDVRQLKQQLTKLSGASGTSSEPQP